MLLWLFFSHIMPVYGHNEDLNGSQVNQVVPCFFFFFFFSLIVITMEAAILYVQRI